MNKTVLKLRKLLLRFVPHQHCNLYVSLSPQELQQRLINLSINGIVETNSGFLFGGNIRYSITIINDTYFQMDGPVGYKRLRLLTQGQIKCGASTNDEVNLELKMQVANQEILMLARIWLLFLCFYIYASIFISIKFVVIAFIHLIFLSLIWYVSVKINIRVETNKIMNILRHQLKSK
jgi:hypothetical protein